MRKLLVAALLGLVPATVFAQASGQWGQTSKGNTQTQVVGGFMPGDTTFVPLQFDANGNVRMAEQFSAQGYSLIKPSVLSTQFLRVAGVPPTGNVVADSCPPVDVRGYNRLALLIYPMTVSVTSGAAADSLRQALLGFSWRLHGSATADTQSTYLELPWIRTPNRAAGTAIAAGADTGFWKPDTVGTTSIVAFNLANSGGGAGVSADQQVPQNGEFVIVLNAMSPRYNGTMQQRFPRGRIIYLKTHDGADVSGAWISFYWRVLGTVLQSTGNLATNTQEVRFRVRADLVGWR